MPEKCSNKVLSISSVDTQMPSTSTPNNERECSIAVLVEICGAKFGVYSPIIAIDRFTLPLRLIIEYNYAWIASRPSKTMTAWDRIRSLSSTSSTSMKPVRSDAWKDLLLCQIWSGWEDWIPFAKLRFDLINFWRFKYLNSTDNCSHLQISAKTKNQTHWTLQAFSIFSDD